MNIKRHSIFLWLTTSILAILMAVGMTIYFNTYQASPLARRIAKTATNHKNYLLFRSKGKVKANIIFYQGALVEEEAYSQLARDLADKGYNTYILKTPLNLPVLSPHKAKTIINQNHLTNVYLAGHSLGGVVASQNAKVAPVRGLILLASQIQVLFELLSEETIADLVTTDIKKGMVKLPFLTNHLKNNWLRLFRILSTNMISTINKKR